MTYRLPPEQRLSSAFEQGHHVLVDASGAGGGRYVMALLELRNGKTVREQFKSCVAVSSVQAELEAIEWAFKTEGSPLVWNDCTPALDLALLHNPEWTDRLFWPSPRMRKPFHDRVHELSVQAREHHTQ